MNSLQSLILLLLILLVALPGLADPQESEERFLGPSGGQLGIGGDEGFGLGTALDDPSALYGPSRTDVVLQGTDRQSVINLNAYYAHKFSEQARFLVETSLDPNFLGLDLSYTVRPKSWDGSLSFNTWIGSGSFAPFSIDTYEVFVPHSDEANLQMVGAGVEYLHPFGKDLDVAFGLNYYQYGFSDAMFAGKRYPVDQHLYPITVGDRATERFASLRIHGIYNTLNDRNLPTSGTKIRFGAEQAIGLDNPGSFNRLSTNIAQLIKAPGFNDLDHSVLLNLQAGTILGNPPPIRAFHLGGSQSVRGYDPGEFASGRSFLQATLEYRHSLTSFTALDTEFDTRLNLFFDYGTVFGSASQLNGMPPYLSNKPQDGYGYGVGLGLASDFGLFRVETAWNDEGRNRLYFTVGERF